jgi:hypothetical protein
MRELGCTSQKVSQKVPAKEEEDVLNISGNFIPRPYNMDR